MNGKKEQKSIQNKSEWVSNEQKLGSSVKPADCKYSVFHNAEKYVHCHIVLLIHKNVFWFFKLIYLHKHMHTEPLNFFQKTNKSL